MSGRPDDGSSLRRRPDQTGSAGQPFVFGGRWLLRVASVVPFVMIGAVAAARDAARAAERSGQAAVAAWAWHQAARLGDPRAGDPLAKLAQSVDCAFIRTAIEDAQAVK